ncbi:MAG: universal stress protein [Xanthomonadales bacterium]|nr:universal stress protein [Gammaproteobacteria bacterium]MBT8065069.1 universal stress protein [Gammaproteobacteria bacterium]NNK31846.1 universal stress protein [Xanthomonadales bacterium]NNK37739.1 universal stress protein [Xanthomonadales bacterium]
MSKVLLLGIDASDCAQRALEYAAERAEVSKVQLIVCHVIEWSPFSFNTPQENEERHQRREAELDRAHEEIVDPVVSQLRERGLFARGVIRHGHAAETLAAVADEFGVTNIIIGKTGSSRIKTQLFGSVANSLVQISTRPVTVVP